MVALDYELAVRHLQERGTVSYLEQYTELASRCTDVSGDVVECGVYNGDSLQAIVRGLPGRETWAYDSFQGFPPAGPNDDKGAHDLFGSSVVGDPSAVVAKVTPHAGHLNIQAGWFKETFKWNLPERVAFLSVDCDLYQSVYDSLETFEHLVEPGGIVTIDDWGCYIGARRAIYDYFAKFQDAPLIRTFGPTQAWWRVGE